VRPAGIEKAEERMAKNPFEFLQEVRTEAAKVTWPSRRETVVTTAMVFVFSIVAALFFLLTDQVIRFAMSTLLNLLR